MIMDRFLEDRSSPIPVVGWRDSDDAWRAARRQGIGGSDVAALLGFDHYRSPWQVWAEKTGHPLAPIRSESEQSRLGHLLEPWLLEQAGPLAYPDDETAEGLLTPHRLYAHPEHPWRLCSPDGCIALEDRDQAPFHQRLVQCKTGGLLAYRAPRGWDDGAIPLGYELQARWEMHVMHADVNHVVALLPPHGLVHRPVVRDLTIEAELVRQVDQWREHYIEDGVEPPLTGRDAAVVAALYPRVARPSVDLDDTDAMMHWQAYRDAHQDQVDAEGRKAEAAVALKALLGDAHVGRVEGRPVAAWGERRGRVDWEAIARELYGLLVDAIAPDPMIAAGALVLPKLEELAEQRRTPTTRTFTIKE